MATAAAKATSLRSVLEAARGAILATHAASGLSVGGPREATRLLRAAEGLLRTSVALLSSSAPATTPATSPGGLTDAPARSGKRRRPRRKKQRSGEESEKEKTAKKGEQSTGAGRDDPGSGVAMGSHGGPSDGGGYMVGDELVEFASAGWPRASGAFVEQADGFTAGQLAGRGFIAVGRRGSARSAASSAARRREASAQAAPGSAAGSGNGAMAHWLRSAVDRPGARLREQLG